MKRRKLYQSDDLTKKRPFGIGSVDEVVRKEEGLKVAVAAGAEPP